MDCKRVAVTYDDDPLAMAGSIGPPPEAPSAAARNAGKSDEEAPLAKLDVAKTRVVIQGKPAKDRETAPETVHGNEVLTGFVLETEESIQPLADASSVSEEQLPASNDGPFGDFITSVATDAVVSTASAAGFVGSGEDEATEDLLVARLLEREKDLGGATDLFGQSAVKGRASQAAGPPVDLGVEDQFLAKLDQALAIRHEEQPTDRSSAPQSTAQPAGLNISDDFDFDAYIKSATADSVQPTPRGGGQPTPRGGGLFD